MQFFTIEVMRELLDHSLETAQLDGGKWKDVGKGPRSHERKAQNPPRRLMDDFRPTIADLTNWSAQRAIRKPTAQHCREFPFREKTRLLTLSLRRVQNEASR